MPFSIKKTPRSQFMKQLRALYKSQLEKMQEPEYPFLGN
jgi:hypothetical protein